MKLDLGKAVEIQQITTISRHKGNRAPQVYTLYVSDGTSPDFDPATILFSEHATGRERDCTRYFTATLYERKITGSSPMSPPMPIVW